MAYLEDLIIVIIFSQNQLFRMCVELLQHSRGGYSFSKRSVKDLTRLASSKAVYRETQMAWISIISLFCLYHDHVIKVITHIFHSKTQYLGYF